MCCESVILIKLFVFGDNMRCYINIDILSLDEILENSWIIFLLRGQMNVIDLKIIHHDMKEKDN